MNESTAKVFVTGLGPPPNVRKLEELVRSLEADKKGLQEEVRHHLLQLY